MRVHNMLQPHPVPHADMERFAMTSDQRGDRRPGRGGSVPLFRRGRDQAPGPAQKPISQSRDLVLAPVPHPLVAKRRMWESLNAVVPNGPWLQGNGLFPEAKGEIAAAFDLLRTQSLQAMSDRGWMRLAVTSPTRGCGATLVAANLALSFARRPASRAVLLDLDLAQPALDRVLGLGDVPPLRDFLLGDQPLESNFLRIGQTLALGLNGLSEPDPASVLLSPDAALALESLVTQLEPEIVIMDMPPALGGDEVIALRNQIDAVLLVADGTRTAPEEIRACERLFKDRIPLLGVVLNRAEDRMPGRRG